MFFTYVDFIGHILKVSRATEEIIGTIANVAESASQPAELTEQSNNSVKDGCSRIKSHNIKYGLYQ